MRSPMTLLLCFEVKHTANYSHSSRILFRSYKQVGVLHCLIENRRQRVISFEPSLKVLLLSCFELRVELSRCVLMTACRVMFKYKTQYTFKGQNSASSNIWLIEAVGGRRRVLGMMAKARSMRWYGYVLRREEIVLVKANKV